MKTIKLILLIIIFSVVTDRSVYFILSLLSQKVYSGQNIGKLNHFFHIKDKSRGIIFGSSRANHHINPDMVDGIDFNMGMDGRKIAYMSTLIKTLSQKSSLIILHLDPSESFDEKYTGDDVKTMLNKYHKNKIIKQSIDNLKKSNILQNVYWTLDYNGKLLSIVKNNIKPKYDFKKYNGFDPIVVSYSQRKIFMKQLKQKNHQKLSTPIPENFNKIFISLLKEIKNFCIINDTKLIVYTSPVYKDSVKDDNIKFSELMKDMKISYFDYSDFFLKNNNIEFWKDFTHLSNKGATILSKQLNKDLISLVESGKR